MIYKIINNLASNLRCFFIASDEVKKRFKKWLILNYVHKLRLKKDTF